MKTESTLQAKHSFVAFEDLVGNAFAPTKGQASAGKRVSRRLAIGPRFWFLLVVILPTALAAVYYSFIAAGLYYSEASFVVRTSAKKGTDITSLSDTSDKSKGLGQLTGASNRSDDDAYAVNNYVLSRNVVMQLEKNVHLREMLNRPEADFWARFPRLPIWNSFEDLYKAYRRFVDVTYDESEGISTVKVTAFRPQDAQAMATALLSYAEDVVNRLNERSARDSIVLATKALREAEQSFAESEAKLAVFRNTQMIVDPTVFTSHVMDIVGKLTEDMVLAKAELATQQRSSPSNPAILRLKDQIGALQSQIDEQERRLTGSDTSVAAKISEYEQLAVAQGLAEKDLETAHQGLLMARLMSEQQHVYLETIVQPTAPDAAIYPRGLAITAGVFGVTFVVYGIGWLIVAGVREHTQH